MTPDESSQGQPNELPMGKSFTESEQFKSLFAALKGYGPLNALDSDPKNKTFHDWLSGAGAIPVNSDDKRPPWVFRAWNEAFRAVALWPDESIPDTQLLGHLSGLVSSSPDAKQAAEKLSGVIGPLVGLMPKVREMAAQASVEEAAEFFAAQKKAKERAEQAAQMSQRTKIFFAIAGMWEQVAKFKSTTELFNWLCTLKSDDGRSLLAPNTQSREIRKVCKIIGLRYPKSKET